MHSPAHTTHKTSLLIVLTALLLLCAACAKNADDTVQSDMSALTDTQSETMSDELPVNENAAVLRIDETQPVSEEEAASVQEYLYSQLGGNHPSEEQFDFSFPISGKTEIDGKVYYIGSWEMRLYNEMGDVSSSQVIMDFILPTDYTEMYEIYGEDGEYTVYMRDILHQN